MEPTMALAVLVTATMMTLFGIGAMVKKRVLTGIVVSHQIPLAEYVYDEEHADGHWLIWLSYNKDRSEGTALCLRGDGSIIRQTFSATGLDDTWVNITPKLNLPSIPEEAE